MTDALRGLVRRLRPPRGWRWPGAADPRLSVLAEIGRLGDASVLPYLLRSVAEGEAVGQAAAAAADRIFDRTPIEAYPSLDARVRGSWWWTEDAHGWVDLNAARLRRHAPSGWLRAAYFGLASFHRDGRVREAAVEALAEERTGKEIPFLVLRLNDWVAPVREHAERAVRDRLGAEHDGMWGRALPLVLGLEARERHDASFLLDEVVRLLTATPDALLPVLTSPSRAVRRGGHRLALGAGGEAARLALQTAPRDADLIVRLQAAKALRSGRAADPDAEAALLEDPAVGVRREVLLGLAERDAPGAEAALRGALLDESAGIRNDARHFLAKRTGEPVGTQVYRAALTDATAASTCRASLGGLAETGTAADAEHVLPHLADDRPSVRDAALRAVLALSPAAHAGRLLSMADDPSPRVVRTLVRAVVSGRLPVSDPDAMLEGWHAEDDGMRARESFRGLAALPFWTRLPHLLVGYASPDPRTAAIAHHGVDRWLHEAMRVFTAPAEADRQAIRRALTTATLPEDVRRQVQAVVDRRS